MPAFPGSMFLLLLLACLVGVQPAAWAADTRKPTAGALEPVMAGEFALQNGQLDDAARWYLEAARATDDAGLAERATRIALLANDDTRAAEGMKLWRARAPQSLAMRAAEATLALRRGDERLASRDLESLVRDRDPDGWRHALIALGNGGKDPKLSARLLARLVDSNAIPDNLQAWLAFGGLAQRLDEEPLAERMVAEVVKRFPGEPRVALLRASQLREAGKLDNARTALSGLQPQVERDADLRLAVAAEYDALGDAAAAAAVLARGPQDEQSYGLRASLLARAEDNVALARLYDELRKGAVEPDPQRRLLLGQTAEFLKRYPEALEWYRGVPGGSQRWTARLRAANVLHELKRGAEAYAEARKLQTEASASEDARRDAYLLEAELGTKDKDDAGELDAYARGLAVYPDDAALLYSRALAWERRDMIDRAEADFRKILVAEPDNVAALNALGYTLADRTTRFTEALELIDRARVAEPGSSAIIDSYGWVLYRLGRNKEALVELRRAFALDKDPEIGAHLGEVLWVTGNKDEARKYFEEARKLDPENRALKRALMKFSP
ncbi:MAG: tetratricopeptide repeat protein [Lysobacter sp.]|nr:tetratricopeptide repeat protein [Lysobacter sp.]